MLIQTMILYDFLKEVLTRIIKASGTFFNPGGSKTAALEKIFVPIFNIIPPW